MLEIHFMRHGETAWSRAGQHTGSSAIALTPHGEEQARALAPGLVAMDFSLVLTSPSLRARSTCQLAGLAAQATTEPLLAEWDSGDDEGLRSSEIRLRRPRWDLWEDGFAGGESPAEVGARADQLIVRLCREGGRVALFSHAQFGRVLAARWIGLPVYFGQHLVIDPASIGILGFQGNAASARVVARWNCTAHLGQREAS